MAGERLDKFLANRTVFSRSEIRDKIKSGMVSVNDETIVMCDFKIYPESDIIYFEGREVSGRKYVYLMMNKPKGVLSACSDSSQKTVINLLPNKYKKRKLSPVGRLDKDTTGFLILTDDGDFVHRVISPKSGILKEYEATLDKPVDENVIAKFKSGITLKDSSLCMPADLEILSEDRKTVKIGIKEGKYHQIKRMFGVTGQGVNELKRISIGGVKIDKSLTAGEVRELTDEEIRRIDENVHSF